MNLKGQVWGGKLRTAVLILHHGPKTCVHACACVCVCVCVLTCDVDLSGVTVLTPPPPPVAGDNGPTIIDDVGGLLGVPLNTSSSFCVNCANPCVAIAIV